MSTPPLKKILHVDDSQDIRELVRHGLDRNGRFELAFCANSHEAIDKAPAFAPDLLLLDSVMPDTSGTQLYARLKALPGLENTPVVFLTTEAETLDFTSFIKAGALDVIGKPFDVDALADTLEEIWREHWSR